MKKYTVDYVIISKKQQNNMRDILLKNYTFNRISDEKVDDIAKLININRHLIISYRTLLLKEKIIFNHGKIKSKINNVLSDYDNNILKLSKKYDSSPISILRLILKKKYPIYTFKNYNI